MWCGWPGEGGGIERPFPPGHARLWCRRAGCAFGTRGGRGCVNCAPCLAGEKFRDDVYSPSRRQALYSDELCVAADCAC